MSLNINFIVDANSQVGFGHLMRCIPVAIEFKRRNYFVKFWGQIEEFGKKQLLRRGIEFESEFLLCSINTNEHLHNSIVFIDNYKLSNDEILLFASKKNFIVKFNDEPCMCNNFNIIIDYTLGRGLVDYKGLVSTKNTVLLLGPRYFPLREEIKKITPKSHLPFDLKGISILFGGTDKYGATKFVFERLLKTDVNMIKIFISSKNSDLKFFLDTEGKEQRVNVLVDKSEIGEDLMSTDLVVGAPGISSYERWYLRIPSVIFSIADNHSQFSELFNRYHLAYDMGEFKKIIETHSMSNDIVKAINQIKYDTKFRETVFSGLFSDNLDGHGAHRIVASILCQYDDKGPWK